MAEAHKWEEQSRPNTGGGYYWNWDADKTLIGVFKGWRESAPDEAAGDAGYLIFDVEGDETGNAERAVSTTVVLADYFHPEEGEPVVAVGAVVRIEPTGKQGRTRTFTVDADTADAKDGSEE